MFLNAYSVSHWPEHFTSAAAQSLQLCPTLCDPIEGSLPGSPILGILQARTLEWVAIPFSNAWKWKVKVKWLSHIRLLATPWTAAYQAPPSMGFFRQEYWSGVPLPSLTLHLVSPLTHPIILWGKYNQHSDFTEEGTKGYRNQVICPKSYTRLVTKTD